MSIAIMLRSTALLTATALTTGCFATSHQPRDRRKVYMTMSDGMRGYSRDGQFYSEMGFGGGLQEAVQGNPRASAAADTFRERMILGFLGLVGGAVCLPTVVAYAAAHDAFNEEPTNNDGIVDAAPWIALGCTAAMIIGSISIASAMPYQFDAINIYNDDVDAATYQQQWVPPRLPQPAPIAPVTPIAPVAPMAPPVVEPPVAPAGPGGF